MCTSKLHISSLTARSQTQQAESMSSYEESRKMRSKTQQAAWIQSRDPSRTHTLRSRWRRTGSLQQAHASRVPQANHGLVKPRRAVSLQSQCIRLRRFVSQHVLFHESVSISPHFTADSLLSKMTHQQVRLTERAMSLIRRHHPHLVRSGEFRQDLKELEFSPSWTVSESASILGSVQVQWRSMMMSLSVKPSRARQWSTSRRARSCSSDLKGHSHGKLGVVTVKNLKLSSHHVWVRHSDDQPVTLVTSTPHRGVKASSQSLGSSMCSSA